MTGRVVRRVATLVAVAVVAAACEYAVADPGTAVACAPLRVEINRHGTTISSARRDAIVDAVEEFGALVGRSVDDEGLTSASVGGHDAGDPLLIEIHWPDGAPSALGFGEAVVAGGEYVDGWIYLNPVLAAAPTGVIRRVVLHELGHVYGLDDVSDGGELMNPQLPVDDYGPGDLVGLILTHSGGCPGNTLGTALAAAAG